MKLVEHTSAEAFQAKAWPMLLEREAENNLMIGIVERLAAGVEPCQADSGDLPRLWTVEERGEIVAATLITPPHRLILTPMTADVVGFVSGELHAQGVVLPGVVGPKKTSETFADCWSCATGQSARLGHALRIYQLDRVWAPSDVPGQMETAKAEDFDLLWPWQQSFCRDCRILIPPSEDRLRQRLEAGEIALWLDPSPVSMAAAVRPTPHGICIGGVYTPPDRRRRGYATALVAALSQRLLDSGRRFCLLFADLANPTSNGIYQRIGYRPVCDFAEYDFVSGGT